MTKTIKEVHDKLKLALKDMEATIEAQDEMHAIVVHLRGKFVPEMGGFYFDYLGNEWKWLGDPTDKSNLYGHGCFRTKEDADLYRRITERAHELIGDWVADWNDNTKAKYCLYFSHNDALVKSASLSNCRIQGGLFMPKHAALSLLSEFPQQELQFFVTGEWV